ncbi:MAG: tryptophan synthase subunit alpha [Candidatus Pacebacteria bacterium]|nr:tryptophan synthase subunit alpha [Candidatus Paceibacterota bacterium]
MNRLNNVLRKNKEAGRGIFMAGMVPGFPDLETSFEIAKTIIEAGADILELSSSFSDPVADGPTLQQAHNHVLGQGISKEQIFRLYERIRSAFPDIPMFVIEYANCVHRPGIDSYYRRLAQGGVDSLLIPDLSLEEAPPFLRSALAHKIKQVFIAAPTTPDERIMKLSRASSGFLYLVTITGVTGQRDRFSRETSDFIKRVKTIVGLPVIAGFGIASPEHVKQALSSGACGAVSCSSIVNLIRENGNDKNSMAELLSGYIKDMKAATNGFSTARA